MLKPEQKLKLVQNITEATPKAVQKAVSLFAEELQGQVPETDEARRLALIRLTLDSEEAAAVLYGLMPDTKELQMLRKAISETEDAEERKELEALLKGEEQVAGGNYMTVEEFDEWINTLRK